MLLFSFLFGLAFAQSNPTTNNGVQEVIFGEVDVDGGIMIVSDAENFPKYFDPPHLYTHENPEGPTNAKLRRNKKYPEIFEASRIQYNSLQSKNVQMKQLRLEKYYKYHCYQNTVYELCSCFVPNIQ